MKHRLTPELSLPADWGDAALVGRAWIPGAPPGPAVVALRPEGVFDLSRVAATMSALLELPDPVGAVRSAGSAPRLGEPAAILANSAADAHDPNRPWLLVPCDLQAIKASGVTFVASLLERVIEEQARGDASRAEAIRGRIASIIGPDFARIRPGSAEAERVKAVLIEQGAWSQYLEVGIGPDAEIFTKCQPLSAVGTGADIGILGSSTWNNPEPEIVLAVNSRGATVGATLGNDVNLRDVEGRSALLLGRAKDNNGSCAIGPLIRLFDRAFGIDDVRAAEIALGVDGPEGFRLDARSSMAAISRDPLDIVGQAIGPAHQYPDGMMLFLGTMFTPVKDRDRPGQGFTHKIGDLVTISTPRLGALVNRVGLAERIAPWNFGAGRLMENLARRGLL